MWSLHEMYAFTRDGDVRIAVLSPRMAFFFFFFCFCCVWEMGGS